MVKQIRQYLLSLLTTAVLFGTLGSMNAWAQCGPSTGTNGFNGTCYMTDDCFSYHWCIQMFCYVTGECNVWPGVVHECVFAGCYNPLWGNCNGNC